MRIDVASQLCNFDDEQNIRLLDNSLDDSDLLNQTTCATTRSYDLDCDTSYDLDHNESLDPYHDLSHDLTSEVETSCEYNDTHLEDSVVVEDNEVINDDTNDTKDEELQYEFISSSFTSKVLMCTVLVYIVSYYRSCLVFAHYASKKVTPLQVQ